MNSITHTTGDMVRVKINKILLYLTALLFVLVAISPTTKSYLHKLNNSINPIFNQVTASNIEITREGAYIDFSFYKRLEYFTPVLPFTGYYGIDRFPIGKSNFSKKDNAMAISRAVGWNYSVGWFLPDVEDVCKLKIYTRHKYIPPIKMDGTIEEKSDLIITTEFFNGETHCKGIE